MTVRVPQLTRDQIVFFHVNGYLTLDRLASSEEVRRLRTLYDNLFASKAGWSSGDAFDLAGTDREDETPKLPQILDVSRYAPELKDFGCYRAAYAVARQLLGDACVIKGEHAINKIGGHENPTPWHQDEAYWDPSKLYETVSIWMPLQDVTPDNGCMNFLPRSHKLGVVRHQSIGGDVRVHGLEACEKDLDFAGAVACPLRAGGATIHGGRTLHYAGPNRTKSPRRALIFMAELPPAACPLERHFPWNDIKRTARAERAAGRALPGG